MQVGNTLNLPSCATFCRFIVSNDVNSNYTLLFQATKAGTVRDIRITYPDGNGASDEDTVFALVWDKQGNPVPFYPMCTYLVPVGVDHKWNYPAGAGGGTAVYDLWANREEVLAAGLISGTKNGTSSTAQMPSRTITLNHVLPFQFGQQLNLLQARSNTAGGGSSLMFIVSFNVIS